MYPVLLRIGNFPVYSYGILIAIGFLAAVWFAKVKATKLGLPPQKIVDLCFLSLLVGLVGSRIIFVITLWHQFSQDPISALYVWEGGLVFYGGPLLCIPFYFWYTKRFSLSRFRVMDLGAQSLTLAHAFGRLGCLMVGCCYGKPSNSSWWGIAFYSPAVEESYIGVKLHPTQAYESVALFGLFFYLNWLDSKKKFDGQVALTYLILYSMIRFIIEFFRGDLIRGFVIEDVLSTSQFIALIVFVTAIVFYRKQLKKV